MHVCVYAYTKEGNLIILITQMELESIIVKEVRQTHKDKYYIIVLICEIVKKEKQTNLNSQTQRIDCRLPEVGVRSITK